MIIRGQIKETVDILTGEIEIMEPIFLSRPRVFLLKLALTAGMICILSGLGGIAFSDTIDDVMDDLMDEIRSDVNQDIKVDVRQRVSAENLSPSGGFSGIYVGLIEDVQTTCSLIFTETNVSGTCTQAGNVVAVIQISGTGFNGVEFTFIYTITIKSPISCGPESSTGSVQLESGTGEPGTTFFPVKLSTSGLCFPMSENDARLVKQ